ncbi:MAG: PIN domain-containing protein [Actinobacteria bacterium]|nr:PIN domain-containing protein [Actinomycetota bacterium]
MKIFFDTSVLVAAVVNAHPKHANCLPWLQKVKKKEIEGIISVHSLIEIYSILTKLPLSPRINPALALNLIKENILEDFELVTYGKKDYINLLDELSRGNIAGGASYDGLILNAAKKVTADKILTLNVNDFIRVCPQLVRIISEP